MAEAADEPAERTSKGSARKKNLIVGGVLLGVMLAEGVTVAVLVKGFGPNPSSAQAGEGIGGLNPDEGTKASDEVEVRVARFRALNEQARQLVYYDLEVYVTVAKENEGKCKDLIERRQATIQDHLSSVIQAADPKVLMEADRAALRQQFKQELGEILGDAELIHQVLIPSLVKTREG
jgi:flagellar basal body-associated protein FliL